MIPPPPAALGGPHAAEVSGSLLEQAAAIRRGELSSRELTRMYLERIDALDGRFTLNSFILSRGEQVLAEAAELDHRQASGRPLGALHGIPLGIKDNLFTAGTATTAGTAVLGGFVPSQDAAAVRLLTAAGALVLGKNNLHECSFGVTSDNPHFGAVRNPYDPRRIPGGSSGGSGAAVAARLCSAAIGTDTGGSVRIPAALCGVVGLKPTLGRVSRARMFGLSWSYDVIGPIARSVEDAAVLLRVASAGRPPRDAFAFGNPAVPLRGARIGVPDGYFADDNTPDVDAVLKQTQQLLEQAGAILVPVTVGAVEQAVATGSLTVLPEAVVLVEQALNGAGITGGIAACLGRFGADVRTALGSQIGPAAEAVVPAFTYAEAMAHKLPAIRRGFADALAGVDALLTPATPAPASPIAEGARMLHNGRTVDTFETFTRYTSCVSMAGLPAISLPAGTGEGGLPIGVQLIGAPWSEAKLIGIALACEQLLRSA